MTVEELGQRMSSRELTEWRAYYDLEPFGDCREDFRTGILASLIANMFRGKGDKVTAPLDFMIHQDAKIDKGQPVDAKEGQQKMIDALKKLGA